VDEFAHGGADVGLARLAVGLEALAEGADGGVVGQGRQHRHVQPGRVGRRLYRLPTRNRQQNRSSVGKQKDACPPYIYITYGLEDLGGNFIRYYQKPVSDTSSQYYFITIINH